MLCGKCRGDGYLLIKIEKAESWAREHSRVNLSSTDENIEYQPIDCPECLGVGEIKTDSTPKYPDSHGNNDYE